MSWLKRGPFLVVTLLIMLGLIEAAAQIAYRIGYGQWYQPGSIAAVAPDEPEPDASDRAERKFRSLPNMVQRALMHPYVGFIPSYTWLHATESDLWNLPAKPPKRGPHTFVVGLFGASIAQRMSPTFTRDLTEYFAQHNPSVTPIVVTLATGGFRQPQHLITLSYALSLGSEFDAIVNLDGFNEIEVSLRSFRHGVSPFYPRFWDVLTRSREAEGKSELLAEVADLRRRKSDRKAAWADSLVASSAVFGLVDAYLDNWTDTRIRELNADIAEEGAADSAEARGRMADYSSEDDVLDAVVETWATGSRLMNALAAASGATYYHFLPPNQYVPDSKPLSDEERATAYREKSSSAETVRVGYPLLRATGPRLRAEGILFEDATQIFATHPETLYVDPCCHLNETGYRLLSDFIIERMAAGAAFARVGERSQPASSASGQAPAESTSGP